jgi:hypothetical protein
MPHLKFLVTALLFITAITLCSSCGEDNSKSKASSQLDNAILEKYANNPDIQKFTSPKVSFLHYIFMDIDTNDSDDGFSVTARGDNQILFSVNVLPKTIPMEVVNKNMINGFKFGFKRMGITITDDNKADAQRNIGGLRLKGIMFQIDLATGTVQAELYSYSKGPDNFYLFFSTDTKDRELAERYFKIITDSIE